MSVRTRFAPSPTGYLHIGGLRTALYAYLFAKKHNGQLVLRIEDTDRNRLVEGSVENLIKSLEWGGITFDEGPHVGGEYGPYTQSERFDIYTKYGNQLLENGSAYRCFCTKERLDEVRQQQQEQKQQPKYDGYCRNLDESTIEEKLSNNEAHVVRLRIPENIDVEFEDIVRGKISINTKDIDDQVLIKSDGFPTYHLANVVDDHLMKITHVIRAEEWLPSTPKHVLLYKAFGWEDTMPQFAHLPLLLNTDRSKLSKRQNDVAVEDYRDQGYLPEAVNNYIALLGWNPGDDRELFSIEELIQEFDLAKTHKAGAVFDREKLDWMNGLYIRNLSIEDLYQKSVHALKSAGIDITDEEYAKAVISLEQTRIKTINELPELISHFFEDKLHYEKELLKWKKGDLAEALERLKTVKDFITNSISDWSIESLEETFKSHINENDLGMGNTLWPLRVSLCGKKNSPSPFELMSVLGKERTLARIDQAITLLSQ